LGSLREFLESRPDKFTVMPGEGRKYTVALAGKRALEAQYDGPPAKKTKTETNQATSGWDPLVGSAIREIKEQLSQPDNDGYVYVNDWGQRFQASLGTLREFLESRPDKFVVTPGAGKRYTVALVDKANWQAKTYALAALEGQGKVKGKGKGKASSGGGTMQALPAPSAGPADLAARAIAEIDRQLSRPNSTGNVWIYGWNRIYEESLGSLRAFLESNPNKYEVVPITEKKYTVKML